MRAKGPTPGPHACAPHPQGVAIPPPPRPADRKRDATGACHQEISREARGPGCPPPPPPNIGQTEEGTRAGNAEGHEPLGTALPAPYEGTSPSARVTEQREVGGHVPRGSASAQAHNGQWRAPEWQPDRARGTHRPHGMAYQQARTRDTRTRQPATGTATDALEGQQGGGGGREVAPAPPVRPAARAAHTPVGHCTRQGSSGAQRHTPAPQLGSLHASPGGPIGDKRVARARQRRHPGRPSTRGAT